MKYDTSTPVGLLKKARSVFIKHRFIKGKSVQHNAQGKVVGYCALGALGSLSNDSNDRAQDIAFNTLMDAAEHDVAGFNDAPTTRKKDVVALYDKAIVNLEAKDK